MTRYIGGDYHYLGSTYLALNSTNITHHKAYTAAAYNCATIKNSSNTTKYIHNIYVSQPTYNSYYVVGQGMAQSLVGYHWEPIQKGYMFGPYGPLQFWDRPKGIDGLLNVALLKAQPHTLAVALYNTTLYPSSSNYVGVKIVDPTGLDDLATPMKIHVAGFGKYYGGKIVIGGLDTSGRFALWDCNNEDYRFDKVWTNDVVYTTNATNIFMSHQWEYDSQANYVRFSTVNAFIGNGDQGHTEGKMVSYTYDMDTDTYYWNIPYYDKVCYPWRVYGTSCFTSGGGALQNFFRWQPRWNSNNINPDYQNRTLGGAQFYVNRFMGNLYGTGSEFLFASCTYTPSGGSTTGYTFGSTDQGATWTTLYYGDNCYRICRPNPMGGYWAVGYSNNNYWRALWVANISSYWSSKVTFSTTTSSGNRRSVGGDRVMLLNSSTKYVIDFDKIFSGTDQTAGTETLTDENGNAFTAKNLFYNGCNEGNMAYQRAHTFYNSSADNGVILSETHSYPGPTFYRQTINLGGPVLLSTYNG